MRRLLLLGRPAPWTLVVIPVTIALAAALSVVPPMLVGSMIDALQRRDSAATMHQLALFVATTAILGLLGLTSSYSSSIFRETLTRNLQLNLIAKLDRARFDALARLTFGELTNRAIGDPRSMCSQLEYSLFPTFTNLCILIATIAAMLRLDYRLALVAFTFSILVFLPLRVAGPRIAALQKRLSGTGDEFYTAVSESSSLAALAAFRNVVAANKKQRLLQDISLRTMQMRVRQVFIGGLSGVASALINTLGPGAVVAFGAYLTLHGQVGIGTIVTLLIYQSRLSGPLSGISSLQLVAATMGVSTRRVLEIADLPEEEAGDVGFTPGAIVFSAVCAMHDEREILQNVNLAIDRGAHVALVGPSGAGKSSLAHLLTRLYEPSRGTIRIGGTILREFTLESLRAGVCIVAQDPMVLDATFLENLTISAPEADASQIEHAIKVTKLQTVLAHLPAGFDTKVGQRGFRLSGGERQRICLARAVLARPHVLVLDEALTGVSLEMEKSILDAVRTELGGTTIIVITHRTASVAQFDKVFTMDRGRIVASELDVQIVPGTARDS